MEIVIHYHEIALKGKNRSMFEKSLVRNLRDTFKDMGRVSVRMLFGRITFRVATEDVDEVHRRMRGVFGVANYALVREVKQDFEAMCQAAWQCVEESEATSFAVRCRRPDKGFAKSSLEVEREVGSYVFERAKSAGRQLRVDLKNPEMTIRFEIVSGIVLVSGNRRKGPGGLPVGTGGRLVGMFSSGYDSPVACYSMMKRGAQVVLCHFHSYPFTNKASLENCRELAKILTRYQLHSKVYLVGFAQVQEELLSLTPADLRMILYRRSMVRIAQLVAKKEYAEGLITGESLGQVASQTLTNMAVINQAASIPMLRPLVGTDKEEIITKSREIGTYELSSLPYEDCCSLMLSEHPSTHADLEQVLELEKAMNLAELEAQAVEQAEILRMKFKDGTVTVKVVQEPKFKEFEGCLLPG